MFAKGLLVYLMEICHVLQRKTREASLTLASKSRNITGMKRILMGKALKLILIPKLMSPRSPIPFLKRTRSKEV